MNKIKRITLVSILLGATVFATASCGGGGGGGGGATTSGGTSPVVPTVATYTDAQQIANITAWRTNAKNVYDLGQGQTSGNYGLRAAYLVSNGNFKNNICQALIPNQGPLQTSCLDFWRNITDNSVDNLELVGLNHKADKTYPVNLVGMASNYDSKEKRVVLATKDGTTISILLGYDSGMRDANGDPTLVSPLSADVYAKLEDAYAVAIAANSGSSISFKDESEAAGLKEYMLNERQLSAMARTEGSGSAIKATAKPSVEVSLLDVLNNMEKYFGE